MHKIYTDRVRVSTFGSHLLVASPLPKEPGNARPFAASCAEKFAAGTKPSPFPASPSTTSLNPQSVAEPLLACRTYQSHALKNPRHAGDHHIGAPNTLRTLRAPHALMATHRHAAPAPTAQPSTRPDTALALPTLPPVSTRHSLSARPSAQDRAASPHTNTMRSDSCSAPVAQVAPSASACAVSWLP